MDKKNPAARPIRGSKKAFKNSKLLKTCDEIMLANNVAPLADLALFRDRFKDVIAQRMRHSVNRFINRKALVNVVSKQMVYDFLKENYGTHTASFIECTFGYFNEEIPHIDEIDCSSCNANTAEKSFTHAYKDCEKLCDTDLKKVINRIREQKWTNENNDLLERIESIDKASRFFIKYINTLYNGLLPNALSVQDYNKALIYYPDLSTLYFYHLAEGNYQIKTKNRYKYKNINQENATWLFLSSI